MDLGYFLGEWNIYSQSNLPQKLFHRQIFHVKKLLNFQCGTKKLGFHVSTFHYKLRDMCVVMANNRKTMTIIQVRTIMFVSPEMNQL